MTDANPFGNVAQTQGISNGIKLKDPIFTMPDKFWFLP